MLFLCLKNWLFFVVVGCKNNSLIRFVNTLFGREMALFAYIVDFMLVIEC